MIGSNQPITKQCIFCRQYVTLYPTKQGYDDWKRGELIQNAMPELSEDEIDILIHGICGECFDNITR